MSIKKLLGCDLCTGCVFSTVRGCESPMPCKSGSLYTNKKTPNQNREAQGLDMINHPRHYKTSKGLETIDVIEAFTEGLEGIEATDTGNVIKYICRWKHKNGIEDLKKIIWYTNHLINHLKPKEICEDKEEDNNHFKCPKCGGNIKRDMLPVGSTNYVLPSDPHCKDCGIRYVITINEDLSYEIKEEEIFGFKSAIEHY